jgi:endo-1,4-beta-xylanase
MKNETVLNNRMNRVVETKGTSEKAMAFYPACLRQITATILLFACTGSYVLAQSSVPLKDAFKKDFLIGAAINTEQIQEKDSGSARLIEYHFNSLSPENIMKWQVIHPERDRYSFELADQYVSYGQKHKMYIVGHTLVWHSQLAPFVYQLKSADSLLMFMKGHIQTVAGRYAGKVNSWDVVNEALNEDGTMRKSIFFNLLGESFIDSAFVYAAKAAPGTELYYNDYNIEQPRKREGTIALIKRLKAKGIQVDGVGIQGHWGLENLPLKDIEESIVAYSALGVKVSFTELDISVLPSPRGQQGADVNQNFSGSSAMNPYTAGLPDSMQQKLSDAYEALFKIFLKHKEKISRVTFWGVTDGQSWLNGFPVRGRTNYPLLFDRKYQSKPAYYRLLSLTSNK